MRRWLELADTEMGARRPFADRELLLEKGEPATTAFLLVEGAVEIIHVGPDGSGVVVKLLAAPALFGCIELVAGEPVWLETVRGLDSGSVRALGKERFLSVVRSDPAASFECLTDTATAFCIAARHEPGRLYGVEPLLANALLSYADARGEPWDGGVRCTAKRTQADLAAAIGASERSVNTLLSRWKDAGRIDKVDARYVIHDRAFLAETAGELLGSLVHRSR